VQVRGAVARLDLDGSLTLVVDALRSRKTSNRLRSSYWMGIQRVVRSSLRRAGTGRAPRWLVFVDAQPAAWVDAGTSPTTVIHVILVHGSFARNASWTAPAAPLEVALRPLIGLTASSSVFEWSGRNSFKARAEAIRTYLRFFGRSSRLILLPASTSLLIAMGATLRFSHQNRPGDQKGWKAWRVWPRL
jgi:hypothetical protein